MKKIVTVLFYLTACLAWAQTSTVNLTSEKQYIRGFGGINHPEWAGDLTAAQRTTAFGNGAGQMGLTVLRIFVNDDKTQWSKALATAKYAQSVGVTVFATPWNPPASMCETITRNNRQEKRLKYDSYSAYAQHLIDFNNYMKTNGVNLYAMSFANEPDWGFDWTWYSIDEVYNFTKNIAGTLRVNGIKVITAESFSYNKAYYDKVLNDPIALANIDIIGTHLYGSDANSPVSVYNYPLADSKAPGKERWMTEHYTNSDANSSDLWPDANDVSYEIYRCMVEGQMSVYTWWYIRRQYGPMNENGTISKRGYCMAQYSKFIRPGYTRVDATKNPTTGVYISAYKKGDDVVLVAVNRSTSSQTITISVPGTKVTTWEKYVTSGSKSLAKETNINSATGSFQITLDPQSTTSFVGTALAGSPTVSLTSPANNTTFTAPGVITLSATAADANGTISTVQFYNGTTLLGSATSNPYSYTWSNVSPGTYTITAVATDNSGNKTTSSAVTVTVVPAATITASGPLTFCAAGSVVLNANTGTGYSYVWKNGSTAITGATSASYTATQTGSYTVTVTSNAQSATSAATSVTVNALPAAPAVTAAKAYCQNATATQLTATGTALSWYTQPTGGIALSAAPIPATTAVGTTSYYVSQTTNGCESPRSQITVAVNALPPATITPQGSTTFCQGGNVTLNANTGTGFTYKWFNGSNSIGTASSLSLYVSSGSFTVQVTDGNGCKATSSPVTVTINTTPTAPAVTAIQTYCQNATATQLTATGTALNWYTQPTNGIALSTAPTPATTTTGTTNYYVSQTTNGCESSRSQIAVTVNALPTAVITTTTPTVFCQGGSVVLTAVTGASYKWMNGTTAIAGATSQSYTATTAGSYTVEVTNASSCKATSATTTVTVNALPTAAITTSTPTSFCQGGSVILTVGTGSSYKWMNGTAAIAGATSQTYTATTAGNYSVEVTNANSCKSTSASTTVTVNALPTAVITTTTPTAFCQGGSVVLTATAGASYKWMNGANAIAGATSQSYTATTAGNYSVEVTNANSCKSTSAATVVTVNALPAAAIMTMTPTSFCQGGSVVLSATSAASYKWMNGTTTIAGATSQTYTATATGSYSVEVTNANSCKATSKATTVTVNALPTATITANGPTTFAQGGSVELTASAGASYKWMNGTAAIAGATAQTYTATAAGSYSVEVTNADNCSATSSETDVTITTPTTNQPSVITITFPQPNTTVTGVIDITVDVTDPDGSITKVEFLDGTTVIGTSTIAPYTFTWDNPSVGTHSITVSVTDSNGGITTSDPVTITSGPVTTGVQSSNTLHAVVYPNPSNSSVYIDTDVDLSGASFMLTDVLGKEVGVFSTATGTGVMIDVSNQSAGTYVLTINKGDSILRNKITVIK